MNIQLQLANDYVEKTNKIVFLTGKAGTGKTTFLRELRQRSEKTLAIVAPTGVAAINAGGMTIHSLFQLPFGPLLPNELQGQEAHYSDDKKELLAALELLIIDEISMVRPDVLDRIDLILRGIKGNAHAFGGVQLLMIGDLAQLSPIIRDEEWFLLRPYYATPYFFSSLVLQKNAYIRIELETVYRQSDQAFIDILNQVRNQQLDATGLQQLNARYQPDFSSEAGFITLTTHNRIVSQVNEGFLIALPCETVEFNAVVRGEFPRDAYPTDTSLKLKQGAQVMFVKNDGSAEKLYYNGKIGTVTRLNADTVYVKCGEGEPELAVQAVEWTNIKYKLDDDKINETNAGSFAQIPLKLAWAITIHKSQGLTFENAIIDVSEAFAHGQTYVALSRCRSLSGLVLRNPVKAANIIGDPMVKQFNEVAKTLQPDEATLARDEEAFRLFLLSDLFNFNGLKPGLTRFASATVNIQTEVFDTADKLGKHLAGYAAERIQKAAIYFVEKLEVLVGNLHQQLPGLIGQSKEKAGKADELMRVIMAKLKALQHFSQFPFTSQAYLLLKKGSKIKFNTYLKALNARPNQLLYEQLLQWRENRASQSRVMPNMILTEQAAGAIAEKLPLTLKALGAIKGVGQQKAQQYGADIIVLIRSYQQEIAGTADQGSLF